MKLYKSGDRAIVEESGLYYEESSVNWDYLLGKTGLYQFLKAEILNWKKYDLMPHSMLDPPIKSQEIWAAGVTYSRSKEARMEESQEAGGADFYDKVYDADRPELFFKAMANRTVGTGDQVNIRKDSVWNVPEPELTLLISATGTIEGYTIGNDMSSRSIEGENPLYLPQAKVYDRCAALGPCILLTDKQLSGDTEISLEICRHDKVVFMDKIKISRMKRSFADLVFYLYKECAFPYGSFLMTGTGIVPPDDFTLAEGDIVKISIQGIGTLVNTIGFKSQKL